MKKIIPGLYRHYKGTIYHVFGTATHTENGKNFVIYTDYLKYKSVEPIKVWARPQKMFMEKIVVKNESIPRFTKI